MTPTTLLWIRHGDARAGSAGVGADPHILHGHTDVPLSPLGRTQADAVARGLEGLPVAAIYASDLVRARDTAAPAARALGLEVEAVKALRERHFGAWEGRDPSDLHREAPDAWGRQWADAAFAPPGGESLDAVAARVLEALAQIVRHHPGTLVAVVAHGGPVWAALGQALGLALPGLARLTLTHGHGTLVRHFPDGGVQVVGVNLPPGAWGDLEGPRDPARPVVW